MCGIAGICRPTGITARDVAQVTRMTGVLRHRGPDDAGAFHDARCALGHRRLAIIDLSADGRQPFVSPDGRHVLIYNGELFNYRELRAELRKAGWRFSTRTDTEVLLAAYRHYGRGCLERFNGMFAFAVYDTRDHSLFLARDRFGIKPLYYAVADGTLTFASEIKALCRVLPGRRRLNRASLFDYLVFNRTDVWDETFLDGILRLPKGCWARWADGALMVDTWWRPEDHLRDDSDSETPEPDAYTLERIAELLVSATTLRMRSDVPVGSCLSGGLDSSILVGILARHVGLPPDYPAFTAVFPGHPLDETGYVAALRQQIPFAHRTTRPTADGALEHLRDFVYINDEPTTNPSFYSQYEVMRLARDHGVTVLLDGQGGDEVFGGYQYFHGFFLYGLLVTGRIGRFAGELVRCLLRRQHPSAYQTLVFQTLPDSARRYLLHRTVGFMQRDFFDHHVDRSRIFTEFFAARDLNHSLALHLRYKLEHLLRMEDRNSMAFSLEARVPYLDYRLVEAALGLPAVHKIRRGETKYLQKRALGHYTVPAISNRRDKIGFGTPVADWMATAAWRVRTRRSQAFLAAALPDVFRPTSELPPNPYDHWKLNQLAEWLDLYIG